MNELPLKIFHFDFNFVCLQESYIRKWLKKLADMGYNAILWELENKVAWETCPECVWSEAMSKQAFKDILTYSRELGLEAIPLLQTIGHGEYVMLHKEYHNFRENPERHDCYCTSKPEVRLFLKKLINEYLDLFGDIRFFHLGGDEAYEFGSCPTCKAYADKYGRNKLYSEHIIDIAKPIFVRGARAGIWADMVLRHPEKMKDISREFIMWDWNYVSSDLQNNEAIIWGKGVTKRKDFPAKALKKFSSLINKDGTVNPFYTSDFLKELGYDVILCSSSRSAGDTNYCGRHSVHAENIVGCARKTATSNLLGNCITSWAVRLHSLETQEQWLPLAPLTLANPQKSYKELLTSAGKSAFGVDAEDFFTAIDLIGTPYPFNISRQVGIQWTGLKDSLPTPKNYICDYIKEMKSENNDYWLNRETKLKKAAKDIPKGIALLEIFASKAVKGLDIVREWETAGRRQLLHLSVSQAIIDKADGKRMTDGNLIKMFTMQKKAFNNIMQKSQTPKSAALNANLMFDALTEYLTVR